MLSYNLLGLVYTLAKMKFTGFSPKLVQGILGGDPILVTTSGGHKSALK
jgi:hypothetical protein